MLIKFETKSMRVKGIAFHPTRPWVLASLHSGVIQLWDYRIRTLIDRFDEHDGPVRGIAFHSTQPLFVSGGDDYKIKLWNYKSRKCLFTLTKHLDYIRTVQFHEVSPWILSASDDQTIRIWNWQSRQCIATLTGHNHYVMSASFHPKEDLVVSASLDQTIRVWDISGLRQKNTAASIISDDPSGLRHPDRVFGQDDAVVKFVLEGHDRGVNWASFSPNMPFIVSGADDRLIKIWRMNDDRVWEVDQLRGHFNNVSCVIFHPKQEIILSNSEDKTIRVWDMNKRIGLYTHRREHDRFWILSAHPKLNLFGAGHDSGLMVFKLEKERHPFELVGKRLFFVRERYLRVFDLDTGRETALQLISRTTGKTNLKRIAYNAAESGVLIVSEGDSEGYELYRVSRDPSATPGTGDDLRRGSGSSAVFVARNRFAVLAKGQNKIIIKNMQNEITKTFSCPDGASDLFFCGVGRVLVRTEDKMILLDVQMRKVLAELPVGNIKSVVWSGSDNDSLAALISRDSIMIINRKLEQICTVHEAIKVKSAAWDSNGILYYTTLSHIKYCLKNGDSGIIRTLDVPLYLAAIRGNTFYCLDREAKIRMVGVDLTESTFKSALLNREFDKVMKLVKGANMIGQAIISYLQEKGYPEVALHFAQDESTKFKLALECGNIEIALESAKILDDASAWGKLASAALRQGNHQVVEMAYQRTKQFERLSFLYLITGNLVKLRRMMDIAGMRKDIMGQFQNGLLLGDVESRSSLLKEVGRENLAYVIDSIHGLPEAEESESKCGLPRKSFLFFPPSPLNRSDDLNWPLLTVSTGYFGKVQKQETSRVGDVGVDADDLLDDSTGGSGWGDDDVTIPGGEGEAGDEDLDLEDPDAILGEGGEGEGDGWDDLDIPDTLEGEEVSSSSSASAGGMVMVQPGPPLHQLWCRGSSLAVDHIAAGSFESAMAMMNSQAGIVNFTPLKGLFMSTYAASRTPMTGFPSAPPQTVYIQRQDSKASPLIPFNLQTQIDRLKGAYRATFEGKFKEALAMFQSISQALLFLSVSSRQEVTEIKELLGICKEYSLGLLMELKRKELAANPDPARQVELSAYFTHCNLQPPHLMLALRSAMNLSFKAKNYMMASTFARRLLELNPKPDVATSARKVLKFCERNQVDKMQVNYDFRNPFVLCGTSFVPIYQGTSLSRCPYCSTAHTTEQKGKICGVCDLGEIGKDCSGFVWGRS